MPESGIAIVSADWRSQFLDGLAPSDRKRILLAAKPRRIRRQFGNYRPGESCGPPVPAYARSRQIFLRCPDGSARHTSLAWSGRGHRRNGAAAKPGLYLLSTEAVKDCSALVWDRATIRSLVTQYPILLENALSTASDYLAWYAAAHVALTCHSAEQDWQASWTLCFDPSATSSGWPRTRSHQRGIGQHGTHYTFHREPPCECVATRRCREKEPRQNSYCGIPRGFFCTRTVRAPHSFRSATFFFPKVVPEQARTCSRATTEIQAREMFSPRRLVQRHGFAVRQ